MATYSQGIRKGLPRVAGGPAWPDVEGAMVGEAVAAPAVAAPAAADVASAHVAPAEVAAPVEVTAPVAPSAPEHVPSAAAAAVQSVAQEVSLRRGLPRTPGGEPWPPAGEVTLQRTVVAQPAAGAGAEVATAATTAGQSQAVATSEAVPAQAAAAPAAAASTATAPAGMQMVSEEVTLRQGLPRTPGGEPWPAAGSVTVKRAIAPVSDETPTAMAAETAPAVAEAAVSQAEAVPADSVQPEAPAAPSAGKHAAPEAPAVAPAKAPATPAPATPAAAAPAAAAAKPAKPAREPIMIGNRTLGQWVKLAVLWGGGAIVAAGIIVLAARGVTTLPGVPEFLKRYPGEYHLPDFVEPGFPAWIRWAHFLNFFMMVLIIRSGLLVRRQQKPDAFFTPKKGGKKVSIYLWLHTSIDVLWLLNGVAFVVVLFVSGHWARIVPTSWEVFPNALSAALQYLTLQWPVEDGWVNYNSLQQLMYFTVIFIAAPLAAITGVRMSEWWPEKAEKLNKIYPAPVARAIHFPTMLFFVLFILVHVFLVFSTGALKNLNHMFAGTPEVSWVGFWWFSASVLVTAAVTWAARPLVLAPIANLFGRVSER